MKMYLSGVARRRKVGGGGHKLFSRKSEKPKKKRSQAHSGVKVQGDLLKMIGGNYWDYV